MESINKDAVTDSSGFNIFSAGDAGEAHVMAHRMLDEGREEEGYRLLSGWLAENETQGSDGVHLQWHMAVFEIATGRVGEAFERFQKEILPYVPSGQALTDAPSLLWRLALESGGEDMALDWTPLRDVAAARVFEPGDPYVELHHLLAMAGATDLEHLTRWLDLQWEGSSSETRRTLIQLGWALRTYATGDYEVAAALLSQCADRVSGLGGSRAQNELFRELAAEASRRGRLPEAA